MSKDRTYLRLGTRGSLLARAQSQQIANALMQMHAGLHVELIVVQTSGDRISDRPLNQFGGKGLFTKELELALLDGSIDFAVHSLKDLPVTMPLVERSAEELVIAAIPLREDPRDVVVLRDPTSPPFAAGKRIGTSSPRRRCQILQREPGALIEPLRGNIDTRISKVRGEKSGSAIDVVVLALAGLLRTNLFDDQIMRILSIEDMLPAAGQAALALQCRTGDSSTRALLAELNDDQTAMCTTAERNLVSELEGDCFSPIAALATIENDVLTLRGALGARGGEPPVRFAESAIAVSHIAASVVATIVAKRLNDAS